MGKRTSGFQGISRFVLEAFNSEAEPENSTPVASTSTMTSSATLAVTKAELPHPHWVPKYDATGLVPHYTEEDEIPKHLEKCVCALSVYLSAETQMRLKFRLLPA